MEKLSDFVRQLAGDTCLPKWQVLLLDNADRIGPLLLPRRGALQMTGRVNYAAVGAVQTILPNRQMRRAAAKRAKR